MLVGEDAAHLGGVDEGLPLALVGAVVQEAVLVRVRVGAEIRVRVRVEN